MSKETVYDNQIAPRMAEIIDLCQHYHIPMLASFQLSEGDNPLMCSTVLPGDGASEWLKGLQLQLCRSAERGGED